MEKVITRRFGLPHGPASHNFFVDFTSDSDLDHFTQTASGTGAAAATAVNDEAFGSVSVISGTADDSFVFFQQEAETIKLNGAGKEYWFYARCKMGAQLTESDFIPIGAMITDTTLIAGVTDGVLIYKADGGTSYQLLTGKNATTFADFTAVTLQAAGVTIAADASYHVWAIRVMTDLYQSGSGLIEAYYDGLKVGEITTTTKLCDDEELALTFGNQAGAASSQSTCIFDYVGLEAAR